jgi:hypothetical protein
LALYPPTKFGDLVPRPGTQEVSDGRYPTVAYRPDEVAPALQLSAPRFHFVGGQVDISVGELRCDFCGGQVG